MPKEEGAGGSEPKEGEPMHTHREHTLTRSAFGGLACLAGIAVLLVALAAFLSSPAVAGAKVHPSPQSR